MYAIELDYTGGFTTNSYVKFVRKLIKRIASEEEVKLVINFSKDSLHSSISPEYVVNTAVDYFNDIKDDAVKNNLSIIAVVNDDIIIIKTKDSSKYDIMYDNNDFNKDGITLYKDAALISPKTRSLAMHYTALSAYLGNF